MQIWGMSVLVVKYRSVTSVPICRGYGRSGADSQCMLADDSGDICREKKKSWNCSLDDTRDLDEGLNILY